MPSPGELNHLFIQTHHLHFKRAIGRFSAFGLGEGQPKLLKHLACEDGLSQAELGRRSNLEPATVTVSLNRMEKAGLVRRRADETDLRVTRIWLTPEGLELQGKLDGVFKDLARESFDGFTGEDLQQFGDYLGRMKENLLRTLETQTGECK